MPAATVIPISNANVETMIDTEDAYGVVNAGTGPRTLNPHGKIIAYDSQTFSRQQTLEKNSELRGARQSGTRVPGPKAPGGSLVGHMTDQTLPLMLYASLGGITTTAYVLPAPVATLVAVAGLIDAGTHSWKIVINKTGNYTGNTMPSTASNVLTSIPASNGQADIPVPALPTGWTKDVYRTVAGNAGAYKKVNTVALAAAVTTYRDNIADASLGATAPVSATADYYQHVITPWNGDGTDPYPFPSFMVQRKLPYTADAASYKQFLGSQVNKASIAMKSTGFFDIAADFLLKGIAISGTTYDGTAKNWRSGDKVHNAQILAANVLVDGSAFTKFLDLKIDHMNNLATDDLPLGLSGDRGSSIPLLAETQVGGTIKVTDPSALSLIQDGALHTIQSTWNLTTYGNSFSLLMNGIQFDPADEQVQGQGILKIAMNGMASQPSGGNQIVCTVVNSEPIASFIGST